MTCWQPWSSWSPWWRCRSGGEVELASQRLEAIRWLRRVSQHLGRINGHLEAAALTKASGAPPCPTMSPR